MTTRRALLLTAAAALGRGSVPAGATPDRPDRVPPACPTFTGVPAATVSALRRGFNLTGWLDRDPPAFPDPDNLLRLRRAGFTHVRLPVKPELLHPAFSPPDALGRTERRLADALDRLARLGFAVTIDAHPGAELGQDRAKRPALAARILEDVWRRILRLAAGRDPTRILFEVLNEPMSEAEYRTAVDLAGVIRSIAPRHTIVLGPAGDQRIEALEAITPVSDPNVVYAIHFYDPMGFTHQGADWGGPDDVLGKLEGIPFPSRPDDPALTALVARLRRQGDQGAAEEVREQFGEPWTAARVENTFRRADAWARRHDRPVIVNEFGVLSWKAPPAARARWLATVARSAERSCIGWVHWDYADGFGFVRRGPDGRETPDPVMLEALTGGRAG